MYRSAGVSHCPRRMPQISAVIHLSAVGMWCMEKYNVMYFSSIACLKYFGLCFLLLRSVLGLFEVFCNFKRQDVPRLPWSIKRYPMPFQFCQSKDLKRNAFTMNKAHVIDNILLITILKAPST